MTDGSPGASLVLAVNGEGNTHDDVTPDQFLDVGRLQIGDVISADVTDPKGGFAGTAVREDCGRRCGYRSTKTGWR
jgi:hypothetical protein